MGALTLENKVFYVTDTLIPMLTNDLRTVIEARCPTHGTSGGGPNFTAVFLCLSACEVLGVLDARPGAKKNFQRTREAIQALARTPDQTRYREVAGPLFTFFRNGVGHSFLPKSHGGVTGVAVWMNECIDHLGSDAGAEQLAGARQRHLYIRHVSNVRAFEVFPHVLYLDVVAALNGFKQRLETGAFDPETFSRNYNCWEEDNQRVDPHYLLPHERAALGIAPTDGSNGA